MNPTYEIRFAPQLRGRIELPASKSLSARALICAALAGGCRLENLSDCDDTQVLRAALQKQADEIDIHAAGTAMRFATAYFAATPGRHVITGTERMRQRPIRALVDALRTLGAEIGYVENEGYPPLRIEGRELRGGRTELPADISSQYISALLMIGPTLREGLRLRLTGEVASRPYIDMTLGLMRHFGAKADWNGGNEIAVKAQAYARGIRFAVEADWSAASYWYEMVALSSDAEACIRLSGLQRESLQGDCAVTRLFGPLGVETTFDDEGAVLRKCCHRDGDTTMEADFTDCPDLAQTLVVTCAMLGRPFRFTGLQSLRIKETDRIAALQAELAKTGVTVDADGRSMTWDGWRTERPTGLPASISTYDDHRMAMAFAPCALCTGGIRIRRPEVVSKSYPAFWNDLRGIGADLRTLDENETT